MGDNFDYDDYQEELEQERMEEEVKNMKDRADAQMQDYYKNNPAAQGRVNKIIIIALIAIGVMIAALVIFAPK